MTRVHRPTRAGSARRWTAHDRNWREPGQVASQWHDARDLDPRLLEYQAYGRWWDTLAEHRLTLFITREYEHVVVAMTVANGRPDASFLSLPHPSGLAIDRDERRVYVASTRNPNLIYRLGPAIGSMARLDVAPGSIDRRPLVPLDARFYPGCLYLHDLAMVGRVLHANSVGQNAIVRLDRYGAPRIVWWPRCIERRGRPVLGRNHIQLNSIAAGQNLDESCFTASADRISARRPGDPRFPVDRRGVVFSGRTREPITIGLTRPHSARWAGGEVWVANSGYGELCRCDVTTTSYSVVAKVPGWTRGLCFHGGVAFVGTSRVIPRFRQYAPGLAADRSVCGVHAIDARTGKLLGGLVWPGGNQVFAVDWIDRCETSGFPFKVAGRPATRGEKALFYAYDTGDRPAAEAE